MGPTQLFMDTDLDIKPHITAKVAPNEEKINSLRNSGGKGLICRNGGTKIETQAILGNQSKATKFPEDLEVDIVGSTIKSDIGLTKSEDPDATDYSSSFADSASDIENCSGLSEGEVESQFFGDNGLGSSFDTFGNTLQLRFVLIPYILPFNLSLSLPPLPLAFLVKDKMEYTVTPQVPTYQRLKPIPLP